MAKKYFDLDEKKLESQANYGRKHKSKTVFSRDEKGNTVHHRMQPNERWRFNPREVVESEDDDYDQEENYR